MAALGLFLGVLRVGGGIAWGLNSSEGVLKNKLNREIVMNALTIAICFFYIKQLRKRHI